MRADQTAFLRAILVSNSFAPSELARTNFVCHVEVEERVSKLSQLEAEVIRLRFGVGDQRPRPLSYEETATALNVQLAKSNLHLDPTFDLHTHVFGLSGEQVRELEQRGLEMLREHARN